MAFIAAATGVKQLPAAPSAGINGVPVASNEVVERSIKRQLRSFVGRDGPQQVGAVRCAAENVAEVLLVFRDGCHLSHGSIEAGLAHFKRIDDWQRCLLLQRLHPAIPELRLVVEGIQNSRRVALPDAALNADRDGSPVSEGARGIMAGTAS